MELRNSGISFQDTIYVSHTFSFVLPSYKIIVDLLSLFLCDLSFFVSTRINSHVIILLSTLYITRD